MSSHKTRSPVHGSEVSPSNMDSHSEGISPTLSKYQNHAEHSPSRVELSPQTKLKTLNVMKKSAHQQSHQHKLVSAVFPNIIYQGVHMKSSDQLNSGSKKSGIDDLDMLGFNQGSSNMQDNLNAIINDAKPYRNIIKRYWTEEEVIHSLIIFYASIRMIN